MRQPPAANKAPLPDDARVISRHLKSLCYFSARTWSAWAPSLSRLSTPTAKGATRSRLPSSTPSSSAFARTKGRWLLQTGGRHSGFAEHAGLSAGGLQAEQVAQYIRQLGYEAVPSMMDRYLTVMPQLILEAGLGEVSRMGIILNPFLGRTSKRPRF